MFQKFFLLSYFLTVILSSFAQEEGTEFSARDSIEINVDIFVSKEPVEITLIYNIKESQKKKYSDEYLKAELIYHLSDTIEDRHSNIRIKARGNNRREQCSFPPLWINIRKANVNNKTLSEITKIKLVTHCGGPKSYESYILKEFLAYKIYNILSPYSFRVRLVKINYIDTGRKNKEINTYAFLIEPEKMLVERNDMISIKNDLVSIKKSDPYWTNTMSVFQYFIGNSDYAVLGRHNLKLIKDKDHLSSNLIPVPYDFDYTGIVNAHYAIPGDNLGITNITQRYFLGPCRSISDYQEAIDHLHSKRDEIIKMIRSFEPLSRDQREKTITYLEEFYVRSKTPNFIKDNFLTTCR